MTRVQVYKLVGAAIFSPFHPFTFSPLKGVSHLFTLSPFHPFTLSPLKGVSHLFTFSPFHPFTFKRLFTFSPLNAFTSSSLNKLPSQHNLTKQITPLSPWRGVGGEVLQSTSLPSPLGEGLGVRPVGDELFSIILSSFQQEI